MTGHAVVIVGGGPAGLMLALAGVDVAIAERRGLHSRTIEVRDQPGIADRFLSRVRQPGSGTFPDLFDISNPPTRHNYLLAMRQDRVERILVGRVGDLGAPVYRGREVTGIAQDDVGVGIELSGGQSLRAEYLVGCDGGRSLIRKAAGIEFPGGICRPAA